MKKIRIDYYQYRIKKGRADILLQPVEGTDEYCIPYHYVRAEERVSIGDRGYMSEDDGDLVLIDYTLKGSNKKRDGKEWIPLTKVMDLSIVRNESMHVYYNIFLFFLRSCPREGESGIMHKVIEMLETVKIDIAKKEYVERLRRVLEGERLVIPDAKVKQPDPDLIRKEMETLEHFRLHKPPFVPMTLRDGELERRGLYSYERIDWKALGAVIEPITFHYTKEPRHSSILTKASSEKSGEGVPNSGENLPDREEVPAGEDLS